MKKIKSEDLRPIYNCENLGPGVRGKYLESYQKGTNLVLLSPDVAKAFPTEESVNEALRSLITSDFPILSVTQLGDKLPCLFAGRQPGRRR